MRRRTVRAGANHSSSAGFTLVELVLVIVILAILASIAGPRFFAQQPFAERGYADELASSLRYAQKVAQASGCSVRVTLSSAGYVARQQAAAGNRCNQSDTTWSTPVLLPDGSTVQGVVAASVAVSPLGAYTFDAQGRLSASPGTTIAVGARQILLDADTGFVRVQ